MSGDSSDATAVAASSARPLLAATRFTPGTIIGDRYRIVSLLGEGGMGEVYRADDMRLGQRVALKYIPLRIISQRALFDRLCAEVLIGRQISHPNVCRIYDIVEVQQHHFISMQYIDGEDLGSLLRRIGRLPAEKALALARDVCAGLAAAHDHEIVHRDLKPANIMVDSRGKALIADFGLAVVLDDMRAVRGSAGTPAYMAPEQISGGEITLRTDIYALGLVLHEAFTGKKVFGGGSIQEISEQHAIAKTRPSNLAHDIDPAMERLILKCMEENPAERPASAHAVLAALPGGDPLAAAIAAGDTPAPDLVAAAGKTGDLSPGEAWPLFGAAVASLLFGAWVSSRQILPAMVPNIKSREALTDRARDLAMMLGSPRAVDEHVTFRTNQPYLRWLASTSPRPGMRALLGNTPPSAIRFTYRGSPVPLLPQSADGAVSESDPAETVPGMTTIVLDHEGRLRYLRRVPSLRGTAVTVPMDWGRAFEAAALDLATFKPATPLWMPPYGFDQRFAWTGTYRNRPDLAIRVEAASESARAVYFHVIEPWEKPAGVPSPQPLGPIVYAVLNAAVIVAGVVYARRNVLRGRGDKRGALRIGGFVSACSLIEQLATANHVANFGDEFDILSRILATALYSGASIWLLYLAIEPYVRRQWPHMLIAWNRVICGRVRDPLVGRHILLAAIVAGLTAAVSRARFPVVAWLGVGSAFPPNPLASVSMESPLAVLQLVSLGLRLAATWGMAWLTLVVIFRLVLRSYAAALVAVWLSVSLVGATGDSPLVTFIFVLLSFAPAMFYLLPRHGLFALSVCIFFRNILLGSPLTFDVGAWYSLRSTAMLILLAAITGYGFYTALAGKPLFGSTMLEEQPAI